LAAAVWVDGNAWRASGQEQGGTQAKGGFQHGFTFYYAAAKGICALCAASSPLLRRVNGLFPIPAVCDVSLPEIALSRLILALRAMKKSAYAAPLRKF
jgi:hypothetical protein